MIGHDKAQLAADRVERNDPDWKAGALQFVKHWSRKRTFLAEEALAAYRNAGGRIAGDARAWGWVFVVGQKEGWLQGAGFAPAVTSNGSPKTLWRGA